MLKDKKLYAIIPARAGSKAILGKNLAHLGGVPLIYYTISAAKEVDRIDKIYVSSDSTSIIEYANNLNVTGLRRVSDCSGDESTAVDVINDWINISNIDINEDSYVIYLQPTSPLREALHINSALNMMAEDSDCHALISVSELDFSPYKLFILNDAGKLESIFNQKFSNFSRQVLPKGLRPNGAIYIFRISDFIAINGIPSNGAIPLIMDKRSSIDIDNFDDLKMAESYVKGDL